MWYDSIMWWHESGDDERLICDLCPRHCALKPGERGFCFVRENRDGRVVSTTYGRSTGFCIDPIEKKPLHQFYPGTAGALLRHARLQPGLHLLPELDHVAVARRRGGLRKGRAGGHRRRRPAAAAAAASPSPTTTRSSGPNTPSTRPGPATPLGIKTVAVTSGYITETARAAFYELMDAANVDLKGFTERVLPRLLRRAFAAGARHAPLAGPREPDVGRNHQPDHPRGQRLARRHPAGCATGSPRSWGPTCRCTSRRSIPTSS